MGESLFVVGHPVGHSKSPVMHNAAYRALGLDWRYGFMDCESEDEAESFFEQRGWVAVNVTMPYKPLAYRIAECRTDAAVLAQGANVLIEHQGSLFADNTDGKGCVSYLRRQGVELDGSSAVVCGTGPTSMSVMHALVEAGVSEVALIGRSAQRCRQVVSAYLAQVGSRCADARVDALSYGRAAQQAIGSSDIVIDATPLGMAQGDPAPFDVGVLHPGQTVLDVVYGHGVSALVAGAREAGCIAYDGAGMLVGQAVETVYDIAELTKAFTVPPSLDLFEVMADAAGFDM